MKKQNLENCPCMYFTVGVVISAKSSICLTNLRTKIEQNSTICPSVERNRYTEHAQIGPPELWVPRRAGLCIALENASAAAALHKPKKNKNERFIEPTPDDLLIYLHVHMVFETYPRIYGNKNSHQKTANEFADYFRDSSTDKLA